MNISQELLAIQRSLFDDRLDIYVDGFSGQYSPPHHGIWHGNRETLLEYVQIGLNNDGNLISEGDDFIFVSHDPAANMKISFSLKPEPSLP